MATGKTFNRAGKACVRWTTHSRPALAQQWATVNHIDSQFVVLVFIGEIAPQRILRIQRSDRFEGQGLHSPRFEGRVIIGGTFGVKLHAVAELADVLVKGRLKPALAQAAALEPTRREFFHLSHNGPYVEIGAASCRALPRGSYPQA